MNIHVLILQNNLCPLLIIFMSLNIYMYVDNMLFFLSIFPITNKYSKYHFWYYQPNFSTFSMLMIFKKEINYQEVL